MHKLLDYPSQDCLKFGTWSLKKVKVNGFKYIQVHSKHGNLREKGENNSVPKYLDTTFKHRYLCCS